MDLLKYFENVTFEYRLILMDMKSFCVYQEDEDPPTFRSQLPYSQVDGLINARINSYVLLGTASGIIIYRKTQLQKGNEYL
jgi:hypothetical protein